MSTCQRRSTRSPRSPTLNWCSSAAPLTARPSAGPPCPSGPEGHDHLVHRGADARSETLALLGLPHAYADQCRRSCFLNSLPWSIPTCTVSYVRSMSSTLEVTGVLIAIGVSRPRLRSQSGRPARVHEPHNAENARRTLFGSDGHYLLESTTTQPWAIHSTVTDFARLRGLSTSVPRAQAVW